MTPTDTSSSRLTKIEVEDFAPWRKAKSLSKCNLYWLPSDFPAPSQQRHWQLTFFELLSEKLEAAKGLQTQLFLQMKTVYPELLDPFLKTSIEFNPFFGLSRRPQAQLPPLPDMNYVEDLQKGVQKYKFGDKMPDYCYWFVRRQRQQQRDLFLGFGGMTALYTKADPNTVPPPTPKIPPGVKRSPIFKDVLEQWKPEEDSKTAFALKSSFLKKSKELFGVGLEQDPQYPALLFIVPTFNSKDFFHQTEEHLQASFDLFEIYVNESVDDHGVVLAFREEYEPVLLEVLEAMRLKNLWYPGQEPRQKR